MARTLCPIQLNSPSGALLSSPSGAASSSQGWFLVRTIKDMYRMIKLSMQLGGRKEGRNDYGLLWVIMGALWVGGLAEALISAALEDSLVGGQTPRDLHCF